MHLLSSPAKNPISTHTGSVLLPPHEKKTNKLRVRGTHGASGCMLLVKPGACTTCMRVRVRVRVRVCVCVRAFSFFHINVVNYLFLLNHVLFPTKTTDHRPLGITYNVAAQNPRSATPHGKDTAACC